MSDRLTITYNDGVVEKVAEASFIKVVDGVLKFQVADTSYTSHAEGRPLANIRAYKVEGR